MICISLFIEVFRRFGTKKTMCKSKEPTLQKCALIVHSCMAHLSY